MLVADPLHKREARHPWRAPLGGHGRISRVHGAKVDIRTESGLLKDVHHDWVVVIPDDAEDLEQRAPLQVAESQEGDRRSPGEMLDARGAAPAGAPALEKGRLKGLQRGAYVAYKR